MNNIKIHKSILNIGSTFDLARVLQDYPYYAGLATGRVVPTLAANVSGLLTPTQIVDFIDQGHPIFAGISPTGFGQFYPPGMSEHVAVIIGYLFEGNELVLIVNDPYPFALSGSDPYLASFGVMIKQGQYEISYQNFVAFLDYKDSITISQSSGSGSTGNGESGGGGCFLDSLLWY